MKKSDLYNIYALLWIVIDALFGIMYIISGNIVATTAQFIAAFISCYYSWKSYKTFLKELKND